jgi:hypothetical protein
MTMLLLCCFWLAVVAAPVSHKPLCTFAVGATAKVAIAVAAVSEPDWEDWLCCRVAKHLRAHRSSGGSGRGQVAACQVAGLCSGTWRNICARIAVLAVQAEDKLRRARPLGCVPGHDDVEDTAVPSGAGPRATFARLHGANNVATASLCVSYATRCASALSGFAPHGAHHPGSS